MLLQLYHASGYVHANAFSFGSVFGDAVNAQRLSVDTAVSYRFHEDDTFAFSFGSIFDSVFTLMQFRQKRSAS